MPYIQRALATFLVLIAVSLSLGLAQGACVETAKTWKPGTTIKVSIVAPPALHPYADQVMGYANEWESYANVKFRWVLERGDIRINLVDRGFHWSRVGTDSRYGIEPSMQIGVGSAGKRLQKIVLHEFGHALGFHHEHQHPDCDIPWDRFAVYDHFAAVSKWPSWMIEDNIFDRLPRNRMTISEYDRTSIMHYGFHAELTLNLEAIPEPMGLSDGDKAMARRIYPRRKTVTVTSGDDYGKRN